MTTLPTPSPAFGQRQYPRQFHVNAVTDDGITQVSVQGEIDLATADVFRDTVLKPLADYTGTLRIDLSAVTFMDSTGLGALMEIRNAAQKPHQLLVLQRPSRFVTRILELTGLTDAFTLEP